MLAFVLSQTEKPLPPLQPEVVGGRRWRNAIPYLLSHRQEQPKPPHPKITFLCPDRRTRSSKGVDNGFVEALLVPAAVLVRTPRGAGQGLVHAPTSEDSHIQLGESLICDLHSCLVVRCVFALLRKPTQHHLPVNTARRVLEGTEAV